MFNVSAHATRTHDEVLDVVEVLTKTIHGYLQLEQDALLIIHTVSTITPQQLSDTCITLRKKQLVLQKYDHQIFTILDFAGDEMFQHPLIENYRLAFSRACEACDDLHSKLQQFRLAQFTNETNNTHS